MEKVYSWERSSFSQSIFSLHHPVLLYYKCCLLNCGGLHIVWLLSGKVLELPL